LNKETALIDLRSEPQPSKISESLLTIMRMATGSTAHGFFHAG
jgi:hypothetical protein